MLACVATQCDHEQQLTLPGSTSVIHAMQTADSNKHYTSYIIAYTTRI